MSAFENPHACNNNAEEDFPREDFEGQLEQRPKNFFQTQQAEELVTAKFSAKRGKKEAEGEGEKERETEAKRQQAIDEAASNQ